MTAIDHEASARIRRVRAVVEGDTFQRRIGFSDVPIGFRSDFAPAFVDVLDYWRGSCFFDYPPQTCPPSVFCGVPK